MTITYDEESEKETIWFDYETFSDLREIINKIDFP